MAESRSKSDYAYTPDDDPSHWKLDISDKDHAAAAKAALGKGFRGNKVEIPEKDRASVIRKVNEACRRFGIDPIRTSSLSAINGTRDLNVDGNAAYVDATVGGSTLIILPKGVAPEDEDYLKSALWNESFFPLEHALIRAHDLGFDVDDVHFIDHETEDSDDQDEPEPIEPTSSVQPVTEPDPDGNRKMREDLDSMKEKNTKRSAAYDPDYFDFMDEEGNFIDEDEVYEYLNHDPEWGYPDKPGTPQTRDQAWEQWSNENHGDSVVMTNTAQDTEYPAVMISSDGSIIGSDGQSFSSLDEAKQWLADNDPNRDQYVDASRRSAASSDTSIDWYKVIILDSSGKKSQAQYIRGYDKAMNLTVAFINAGIPAMMEPTEDPRKKSSKATAAISVTQQDGSSIVIDDLSGAYGIIYNGPSSFDYEVYDSADAVTPFLVDAAGSSDDAVQDISDALNDLASQLHQVAEPTTDPASSI